MCVTVATRNQLRFLGTHFAITPLKLFIKLFRLCPQGRDSCNGIVKDARKILPQRSSMLCSAVG